MPLELHVRYRVGRSGATVYYRDGRVVQLEPWTHYRFEETPERVVGALRKHLRRSGDDRLEHETKATA